MPKLRGHHLVCLQFFHGEGYTAEFVENLRIIKELMQDELIQISDGSDDVCGKCAYRENDACGYGEHGDEKIREMDETALKLLKTAPGGRVSGDEIREELPRMFREWHSAYCTACEWRRVCEGDKLYRRLRDAM